MSSDARIVDFDPKAMFKMFSFMYRAMLDYTVVNPLTARIQPHPVPELTGKKIELDGDEPYSVIQGSQVTIINETDDDTTVKITESSVFGINEVEVAGRRKATLRVQEDAPPELDFGMSTDSGGISRPITVKPPVVND